MSKHRFPCSEMSSPSTATVRTSIPSINARVTRDGISSIPSSGNQSETKTLPIMEPNAQRIFKRTRDFDTIIFDDKYGRAINGKLRPRSFRANANSKDSSSDTSAVGNIPGTKQETSKHSMKQSDVDVAADALATMQQQEIHPIYYHQYKQVTATESVQDHRYRRPHYYYREEIPEHKEQRKKLPMSTVDQSDSVHFSYSQIDGGMVETQEVGQFFYKKGHQTQNSRLYPQPDSSHFYHSMYPSHYPYEWRQPEFACYRFETVGNFNVPHENFSTGMDSNEPFENYKSQMQYERINPSHSYYPVGHVPCSGFPPYVPINRAADHPAYSYPNFQHQFPSQNVQGNRPKYFYPIGESSYTNNSAQSLKENPTLSEKEQATEDPEKQECEKNDASEKKVQCSSATSTSHQTDRRHQKYAPFELDETLWEIIPRRTVCKAAACVYRNNTTLFSHRKHYHALCDHLHQTGEKSGMPFHHHQLEKIKKHQRAHRVQAMRNSRTGSPQNLKLETKGNPPHFNKSPTGSPKCSNANTLLPPAISDNQWTSKENDKLRALAGANKGEGWSEISRAMGGQRSELACRIRWGEMCESKARESRTGVGSWSVDEDEKLKSLVDVFGFKWAQICMYMPGRVGKQCRERYLNHLDPMLKKTPWTPEEDQLLLDLHKKLKNSWADIARRIEGRCDNDVKNRWNLIQRRTNLKAFQTEQFTFDSTTFNSKNIEAQFEQSEPLEGALTRISSASTMSDSSNVSASDDSALIEDGEASEDESSATDDFEDSEAPKIVSN